MIALGLGSFLVMPKAAYAMHIMEGFLPVKWSISWYVLSLPFLIWGLISIQKIIHKEPKYKMLLGLAGAFVFILSALKIPSVTGSCSHPTGVGLGAILFGPTAMTVIGCIVLIFQALLLAHGGITTLGANTFSMGVVGPFASFIIYHGLKRLGGPQWLAVFAAAALGNLLTYVTTSVQLALAFPAATGGFMASLTKFLGVFALTQLPLAISEGLLTVFIFNLLTSYNSAELKELLMFRKEGKV
ncbi:energy-coupling factor ABC transporter permease [Desulforamulus ferrireducens]|uniref:Cobalt transport protein CbiM n=1 Tax=Desulforamulus ferrireducens TaxID=1833852 RepID=A0A1S6J0K7_9FIRM|nr:energy-coupling factor ABC transporter permease [Desulforamulus ferrireducens]AQS60564.1 cobalamin biosynthesis protein CbiM [Desulforamulus ferrireducens]